MKSSDNMGFVQSLSCVLSKIRHHNNLWPFILNVIIVAIAAVYILVLGYYGSSIHSYQQDLLANSLPTRIVAVCPDSALLDEDMRFDEQTKADILRDERVVKVFEQVKLGVTLSVRGGESVVVYAESTVPGDPGFTRNKMAWGGGVSSDDASEIVVSEALLERMWGSLDNGSVPETVSISAERTVGGSVQRFNREFRLVGVKKGSHIKEAFLPLKVLSYLDLWCGNGIEDVPEPGGGVPIPECRYASARAFFDGSVSEQALKNESEQFNIGLERVGSFMQYSFEGGTPWLVVSRGGGSAMTPSDMSTMERALRSCGINPVSGMFRMFESKASAGGMEYDVRIKAVPDSSDILDVIGRRTSTAISRTGNVLVSETFSKAIRRADGSYPQLIVRGFPMHLTVSGVVKDGTAGSAFDILCSDVTAGYMGVKLETSNSCIVWTPDPVAVKQLSKAFNRRLPMDADFTVAFYRMDENLRVRENERFRQGTVTIGENEVTARFIGDGALEKMSLPIPGGKGKRAVPVVVTISDANKPFARSKAFRDWASREGLFIAGVFHGDSDEVWLPSSVMKSFVKEEDTAKGFFKVTLGEEYPRSYAPPGVFTSYSCILVVHNRNSRAMAKYLKGKVDSPMALEIVEMEVLPEVSLSVGGYAEKFRPVFINDESVSRLPYAWARSYSSLKDGEAMVGNTGTARYYAPSRAFFGKNRISLKVVDESFLPSNFMLVPKSFVSSNTMRLLGRVEPCSMDSAEVMVPEASLCLGMERALKGFTLKRLFGLKETEVVQCRITDLGSQDGMMDTRLVPILRNEIMFRQVHPEIYVEGRVADSTGKPFSMLGVEEDDLLVNALDLLAGEWVGAGDTCTIVLPESVVKQHGKDPDSVIGTTVQLRFDKKQKRSPNEPNLHIRFNVVGVVAGETAYIPAELANNISLWIQGKITYNERKGAFITASDLYGKVGHARCNVYVRDIAVSYTHLTLPTN